MSGPVVAVVSPRTLDVCRSSVRSIRGDRSFMPLSFNDSGPLCTPKLGLLVSAPAYAGSEEEEGQVAYLLLSQQTTLFCWGLHFSDIFLSPWLFVSSVSSQPTPWHFQCASHHSTWMSWLTLPILLVSISVDRAVGQEVSHNMQFV